jgi:UDP-N-acetyl-2-amino-2-deoxyglucuronate dehydrogenase
MKAIKETGNVLIAALDPSDSVGIIDSYFPNADFFTEFERFDRHLEKLRRENNQRVDYISICSPNYLHDAHIRFALRIGADAICEKPVVLNPWNVDALAEIARETQKKVNVILQLRLHPAISELKRRIDKSPKGKKYDIDLAYITARGRWYMISWKGNVAKSGGIATNIGIHFFDMLQWIFGSVESNIVHLNEPQRSAGFLELERARIRWFLSIKRKDLPHEPEAGNPAAYRSIIVDNEEIDFSCGLTDLHTRSYEEILSGRGFSLAETKPSVEIVSAIRKAEPAGLKGEYHPLLKRAQCQ